MPTVDQASPPWQALYRLLSAALAAKTSRELAFIMLNRSTEVAPYHRACLWDLGGKSPALLGVSGRADIDYRSPLAEKWTMALAGMAKPDETRVLSDHDFQGDSLDAWRDSLGRLAVRHVLWAPITTNQGLRAGLWLERWGKSGWSAREVERMGLLAQSYGSAWEKLEPPTLARKLASHARRRPIRLAAAAVALLALFLVRAPLRTVAPCEVAPKDPIVVTAPLNGVVEKVLVRPGQAVDQGQTLLVYDKTVVSQQLEVARKQVQAAAAALDSARVQAFREPAARIKISLLENKLAQEDIKLGLVKQRFSKLVVRSPAAGSVMIENPWEWRGKPVQIGQRVMMVYSARQSELRIWIPNEQRIAYDRTRPVEVLLNAMPEKALHAWLAYVGRSVVISPEGNPSFVAEAGWDGEQADVRIGFRGTAILYGQDVCLAYWLIRRPWAALRGITGL